MASESDKTPQHILVIKAILARITDPIFPRQKALPYVLLRLVTPMLGLPLTVQMIRWLLPHSEAILLR
jgi:hypothetical protein